VINAIRARLAELGIVAPVGRKGFSLWIRLSSWPRLFVAHDRFLCQPRWSAIRARSPYLVERLGFFSKEKGPSGKSGASFIAAGPWTEPRAAANLSSTYARERAKVVRMHFASDVWLVRHTKAESPTESASSSPRQINGTTWAADYTTLRRFRGWDSDNQVVCNTVDRRNGKGDTHTPDNTDDNDTDGRPLQQLQHLPTGWLE
jgi:hypothetical protein